MMALEKRFLSSLYRFSYCSDISSHLRWGLDDWYRERHPGHLILSHRELLSHKERLY